MPQIFIPPFSLQTTPRDIENINMLSKMYPSPQPPYLFGKRGMGEVQLTSLIDGSMFSANPGGVVIVGEQYMPDALAQCQIADGNTTLVTQGSPCQQKLCGGTNTGQRMVSGPDPAYSYPVATVGSCLVGQGASGGGAPTIQPCPPGCTECDPLGNCLAYGAGAAPVSQLPGSPTTASVAATAAPAASSPAPNQSVPPTSQLTPAATPVSNTAQTLEVMYAGAQPSQSAPASSSNASSGTSWFTQSSIDGIPNIALLAGGALLLFLLMGKK